MGTWATSPQLVEPQNRPPAPGLAGNTLRQTIHPTLSGSQIRLRLSNEFGASPLTLDSVQIASASGAGTIDTRTNRAVTFKGKPSITLAAGSAAFSDSIAYKVEALSDLVVTFKAGTVPDGISGHPGSRATSYLAPGDQVGLAALTNAVKTEHWYVLDGVDVQRNDAAAIVTLGDSITDGHGSLTDKNTRWPDYLARVLTADQEAAPRSVLNEGIGGNCILKTCLGPSALSRFERDVAGQSGVRWVIVMEGVNDIGGTKGTTDKGERTNVADDVIAGYKQLIAKAHAHGLKIYGATITALTPSFYFNASTEASRQKVNQWIRTSGQFDAVIDFDQATRDPNKPDQLDAAFDSGDHLHLNSDGYRKMAESIDLSLFSGGQAAPVPGSLQIAFTWDDLPVHGPLPPGETRVDIGRKLLAAMKAENMPPAFGFINAIHTLSEPTSTPMLQEWRKAGLPLGNHTWSHMNLNASSLEGWESDVLKDEAALTYYMRDADWHWLRFPYLAEGDTSKKKVAARKFLALRGYRIAGVTMSFGDYRYNDPYVRCVAKHDADGAAKIEASYLAGAAATIDYSRAMSKALYGRDIPYVLLMHVGALDAKMLPRLLTLYRDAGFSFVSLEDAEQDAFYKSDLDLSLSPEPDTLEEGMRLRHLPLPKPAGPDIDLDAMCK